MACQSWIAFFFKHPVYRGSVFIRWDYTLLRSHAKPKALFTFTIPIYWVRFSHADITNSSVEKCDFTKCVMLFVTLARAKMSGSEFRCTLRINHSNLENLEADHCEWTDICSSFKPRLQTSTFSMTSFYVRSFICQVLFAKCTCVYATNFIWQVVIWQVLFTGVKMSEKGVYRRHDRKVIIVRWPITSNARITLTSFLCWPIQTNKICTLTIFSMTSALVQKLQSWKNHSDKHMEKVS
jgi:hypothetical protein